MRQARTLLAGFMLVAICQLATPASGEPAKARVFGGPPNLAQYIYEIELTAVNGEYIGPRSMLTLESGDYTLTARVPAQLTEPAVGQRKRRFDEEVDFDITLEPGKDYRVRAKWHRNSFEKPYELIIEAIE